MWHELLNQRMNKVKLRHKEGPCVGEALSHLFFGTGAYSNHLTAIAGKHILSSHWSMVSCSVAIAHMQGG